MDKPLNHTHTHTQRYDFYLFIKNAESPGDCRASPERRINSPNQIIQFQRKYAVDNFILSGSLTNFRTGTYQIYVPTAS